MKSLQDLLTYKFHLGKTVVITPKSILLAIVFYFVTWLFLKLIRRIVSRALNDEARDKFKGIFTFFNYIAVISAVVGSPLTFLIISDGFR